MCLFTIKIKITNIGDAYKRIFAANRKRSGSVFHLLLSEWFLPYVRRPVPVPVIGMRSECAR